MELNHNIHFTLGDWSYDGHCKYQDYHMISNYSSGEIAKAYADISKELGWELLDECMDYEECSLSEKGTHRLLELGVISREEIERNKDLYGDLYYIEGPDEFVDLFFTLVKVKLPDLVVDHRDLDEESLGILDGAGYGIFGS